MHTGWIDEAAHHNLFHPLLQAETVSSLTFLSLWGVTIEKKQLRLPYYKLVHELPLAVIFSNTPCRRANGAHSAAA